MFYVAQPIQPTVPLPGMDELIKKENHNCTILARLYYVYKMIDPDSFLNYIIYLLMMIINHTLLFQNACFTFGLVFKL